MEPDRGIAGLGPVLVAGRRTGVARGAHGPRATGQPLALLPGSGNHELDLDKWDAERDQALAHPTSALHVTERYGVRDLDSGEWGAAERRFRQVIGITVQE